MYKVIAIIFTTAVSLNAWANESNYAITYSHAELTTPVGVAAVHERLVQAGRDYCPSYLQMKSHSAVASCVEGVVEDLVKKINQPALTAFAENPEEHREKIRMFAAQDK